MTEETVRRRRAWTVGYAAEVAEKVWLAPLAKPLGAWQLQAARLLRLRHSTRISDEQLSQVEADLHQLRHAIGSAQLSFEAAAEGNVLTTKALDVRRALDRLAEQLCSTE